MHGGADGIERLEPGYVFATRIAATGNPAGIPVSPAPLFGFCFLQSLALDTMNGSAQKSQCP